MLCYIIYLRWRLVRRGATLNTPHTFFFSDPSLTPSAADKSCDGFLSIREDWEACEVSSSSLAGGIAVVAGSESKPGVSISIGHSDPSSTSMA